MNPEILDSHNHVTDISDKERYDSTGKLSRAQRRELERKTTMQSNRKRKW